MNRIIDSEEVFLLISQVLEIPGDNIKKSSSSVDLPGWDSMNHINIINQIQMEYGVKFNLKEMASLKNVGDIIDLVNKKINE